MPVPKSAEEKRVEDEQIRGLGNFSPQKAGISIYPQVELDTNLPSPYTGTNVTPQALMNQFDPNALNQAYDQYWQQYNQDATTRNVQNFLGANAPNLKANQEAWEEDQKKKAANYIQRQKDLQTQATAGITAGTNLQNQAEKQLQFPGTQTAKQIENNRNRISSMIEGMNAQLQQRLFDPAGVESRIAKTMLMQQLNSISPKAKAEIQALMDKEGPLSAAQLLPIMAQYAPEVQKAFMNMLTGAKTAEEVKQQQIGTKMLDTATTGGTQIPQGMVPTINAGPISMASPQAQVQSTAAGTAAANAEERKRNYKVYIEPRINNTLAKLDSTMAGKLTEVVAKWMPANEQQELVNMLNDVNNRYKGALPAEVANGVKNSAKAFGGGLPPSMTNEQLKRALNSIKDEAERDISYQQNTGVNATPTSNTANAAKVKMVNKAGRQIEVPPSMVNDAIKDGFIRQ